jgi:hypothetical protein
VGGTRTLHNEQRACSIEAQADAAVKADAVDDRKRVIVEHTLARIVAIQGTKARYRLGLVTQYQGCGVAAPTWTLAGQDFSAAGSVDDSCQEYGEYHCQAYCQDDQNTSCSFARMVAPETETP